MEKANRRKTRAAKRVVLPIVLATTAVRTDPILRRIGKR